jgi:hypothetical protein
MAEARRRLEALYQTHREEDETGDAFDPEFGDLIEAQETFRDATETDASGAFPLLPPAHLEADTASEGRRLVERSRQLIEQMHGDDREEAINLNEQIESAIAGGDEPALAEAAEELRELLFFVAGRT